MHAGVGGEFGVEGGGHGSSLADGYWIAALGSNDLYAFAYVCDFGGADEDHFEWGFAEGGVMRVARVIARQEFALADGAVDLASVGVAADADVEGAEAFLLWILHFGGEQNCAGAGAEGGFGVDEFFQLGESFIAEEFQERAGLTAWDDQAVDGVELLGLFNEHDFGAEFF